MSNTILNKSILFDKRFFFLFIFLAYILFPTSNSSLDSYDYASYVKYNHYLFTPHHLFSNAIIYVLLLPFDYLGIELDILLFSKMVNSVFQVINLFIFHRILTFLKIEEKTKLLYILILAFSFSLWRYGTENETYIIPITFSLLGSLYFLKNIKKSKGTNIILSSLFGVIACLFHQIHFFWWLGILIGIYFYDKKLKAVFIYLIPALSVPLSYVLVLIFYEKQDLTLFNLMHFVLHDFYQGTVMSNWGWKGFFFQILNTARTYFQLHPNILLLIKNNLLFLIPLLVCFWIFIKTIVLFRENKKLISRKENHLRIFTTVHIFIFLANYSFAFYNYGNVEFMVMLPFILILIVAIKYQIDKRLLLNTVVVLFLWNFFYGIFPNHQYHYYNDKELVEYMSKNRKKTFIIKNHTTRNQYFYNTGIGSPENIILFTQLTQDSLNKLVDNRKEIYTDLINKPEIFNKEKMTQSKASLNFEPFKKDSVFSYIGFYGKTTVYKISKKD